MDKANRFYFDSEDNRKKTLINFRITDSDHKQLSKEATKHGLDLSRYIRKQLELTD